MLFDELAIVYALGRRYQGCQRDSVSLAWRVACGESFSWLVILCLYEVVLAVRR